MIRDLTSDEIECKVATVTEKGCQLLLYKTARTDAKLLDETYGEMNWQCDYKEVKGNMYCTISVWDDSKKQWISKQDCGIESAFGDKEKGEASDAFKRAGFKWGIGVELYNTPFIWIPAEKLKRISQKDNKWKCMDKFEVEAIHIENKKITGLAIKNENGRCYLYNEKGGK
jgi:hypothetical protein